jgi:phospholipase C
MDGGGPLFCWAEGQGLPAPEASKIEPVIVAMMENRSFDHVLGWLPGANG